MASTSSLGYKGWRPQGEIPDQVKTLCAVYQPNYKKDFIAVKQLYQKCQVDSTINGMIQAACNEFIKDYNGADLWECINYSRIWIFCRTPQKDFLEQVHTALSQYNQTHIKPLNDADRKSIQDISQIPDKFIASALVVAIGGIPILIGAAASLASLELGIGLILGVGALLGVVAGVSHGYIEQYVQQHVDALETGIKTRIRQMESLDMLGLALSQMNATLQSFIDSPIVKNACFPTKPST